MLLLDPKPAPDGLGSLSRKIAPSGLLALRPYTKTKNHCPTRKSLPDKKTKNHRSHPLSAKKGHP
jgi:hypothetical protein